LRFVSEALGAQVEWDANTYTAIITSSGNGNGNNNQSVTQPLQEEKKVDQTQGQYVGGVKVLYGKHNYGIRTQAEYDKVMAILKERVEKELDSIPLEGGEFEAHFHRYLNGDRKENYDPGSWDYKGLLKAEKMFKPYFDLGLSKDEVIKIHKIGGLAYRILSEAEVDYGSNSLADLILHGRYDCDPEGYLYSALFDMHGYDTAVVAKDNHAFALVKINGVWRSATGGKLVPTNVGTTTPVSAYRILHQPTSGEILK